METLLNHLLTPFGVVIALACIIAFFYVLDAVELVWLALKTLAGIIRALFR